jgi:thiamine-phosphate pyrophosphorylase
MLTRGLYAIVDATALAARNIDPIVFATAVLVARPAALQLRAKDLSPRDALGLLRQLASLCRRAGVPLFANDRPDLALLAGCAGVHVGQTDMPIEQVRRIAPSLVVGVSTHTPEQLERALQPRPEYVAFGPVFETGSKTNPDPVVGLQGLRAAAALARGAGIPIVAIGGITLERAESVAGLVDAAAVIADLLPAGSTSDLARDVSERARALHALLSASPMAGAAGLS